MKAVLQIVSYLLIIMIVPACIPTGGSVNPNAFTINKSINQLSYPGNGVEKVIALPFINDSIIVSQYDWPMYTDIDRNFTSMQILAPPTIEIVFDSLEINGSGTPVSLPFNSTLDASTPNWKNPYYNTYLISQSVYYNYILNIPTADNVYTALLPNGIHYMGFRSTKTIPYIYFWLKTEIKNNLNGSKQFTIYNGAYGVNSVIVGK